MQTNRVRLMVLAITLLLLPPFTKAQNLCDGDETPIGGVPKELYRGRLKNGVMYGNPYTLMDRTKYPDANEGFVAIRKALTDSSNNGDIRALYAAMYVQANIPLAAILAKSTSEGYVKGKSSIADPLAIWAKNNAYIFVIGLDDNFSKMPAGSPQREKFKNNAITAFEYMNCRVYGKDLQNIMHNFVFTWPLVPMTAAIHSALEVTDKLKIRARELMMYCEAYDWLKASAHEPELVAIGAEAFKPYDGDRNGTGCMARDNLRLFARNFYITANGVLGPIESPVGWKKNHGIMAASAIGMAAVVLNDAGVETNWVKALFQWVRPAPNYSPIKWNELGQKCWESLLEGKHIWPFEDVPQTNVDGTAGYAEGPNYFNYCMVLMLPYMRAYDNWVGGISQEKKIL